jgi:hypothetical protein
MGGEQTQFLICEYCGAVNFYKTVHMKHINQHRVELKALLEDFLDEAIALILRYAEDPKSHDARRKMAVIVRLTLTGTVEPLLLKMAGLEKYEPLLKAMLEEVLKGLKSVFPNYIEVDRGLVASVARDVEERITPDMKEVLLRHGILVGKAVSYVA